MHGAEVLVPISFFLGIALIVKIVTDNRTRQKLIDKGMVDDKVKYLFRRGLDNPLSSLKWGMVMLGIGVALAVAELFPYISESTVMGLMFLFAGIAFVVYFFIARKQSDKTE